MSAERTIALVMGAFPVQVKFEVGEDRRKAIRILDLNLFPAPPLEPKTICAWRDGELSHEQAAGVHFLHRQRFTFRGLDPRICGLRKKCAHFPMPSALMRT